jgi:hypothetical protein
VDAVRRAVVGAYFGFFGGEDMAIPLAQQRKLLQRSGNVCAFPGCWVLLTAEGAPEDPVVVLGEIAHIVAEARAVLAASRC